MFSGITVMWKLPAHSCKHAWEQKAGREATHKGIIQCLNLAGYHHYGVLALLISPPAHLCFLPNTATF